MFQDMIDKLLASTVVDLSEISLTVHCFARSWRHSVCHFESQHVDELVPAYVHVVLGLAVYPVHYGVQHWVEVLEGEGVGLGHIRTMSILKMLVLGKASLLPVSGKFGWHTNP